MSGKKVYLFGAGASHSYTGSINNVKPPLARDFFKAFNKLGISEDNDVRIGNIIKYVADTRNLKACEFSTWNENIEAFLTEIDNKILEKLNMGKEDYYTFNDIKAYDQMIFLFTSVLNEIQNGSICSNYFSLVKSLNENDTLVTFNWDTLLDRALYENGSWYIDDGYDIEFKGIFRDGWSTCNKENKSKVKLLKLHGSTNWLMPYYSVNLYTRKRAFANENIKESDYLIFCFHYGTKPYETYENRALKMSYEGYSPFSYCYYPPNIPLESHEKEDDMFRSLIGLYPDVDNYGKIRAINNIKYSMPFIIPPVKHKNYGLMDGILDHLWDNAEKSINECDELIIIGYSFPQTDTKAWNLLKNALNKRKSYPKIVIVDPYPEGIASRLAKEFINLSNVKIFPITFDKFVEENL